MRKVVYKLFWVWNFDKEEKWLNSMAAKGLNLINVGFGRYVFEEGLPKEYTYRLELLNYMPSHLKSGEYIKFLEDTEVEYIGNVFRWVYFRRKTEKYEFNLYSDIDSRIKHLNKILLLILPLMILELIIGFNNTLLYFGNERIFSLTPGVLCLVLAALLGYGFLKVSLIKKKLKRERALHE